MAKEWWFSNIVFGKQSWTAHSFLKRSAEEGGRGEGSDSHFYTKMSPSLKQVLYSTKFTSPKKLNTTMQGHLVKLLHCMQVVKPRCRHSAFSLCKTERILQQHSTAKNQVWLKNSRKRNITRSIRVSCGFFGGVVVCFFFLFGWWVFCLFLRM